MSVSAQILLLVNRQHGPAVVLFLSASNMLHESTDTYMSLVCCRRSREGLQQAGEAAGHYEIEGRGRPARSPAAASVPAAHGGSPEKGQWPRTPGGYLPARDEGHGAQRQGGRRAHEVGALAQAPHIRGERVSLQLCSCQGGTVWLGQPHPYGAET
jgi:hypothetical protein